MTAKRVTISARPSTERSAEAWVQDRSGARASTPLAKSVLYTARLTIDVTPEMRARIKVAAFQSETTVAELLRHLLDREFPDLRLPGLS
jgi:hypothetical protein